MFRRSAIGTCRNRLVIADLAPNNASNFTPLVLNNLECTRVSGSTPCIFGIDIPIGFWVGVFFIREGVGNGYFGISCGIGEKGWVGV